VIAAYVLAVLLAGDAHAALRIGVATQACASLAGEAVVPGSALVVVAPNTPQQVFPATVERAVSECNMTSHLERGGPYYSLVWKGAKPGSGFVGIAFLGNLRTRRVQSELALDLGRQHGAARVRSCTSQEGLHLTVWSGEPLKSKRLWHEYWYLGIDVEPSCEKRDYERADDDLR
jgi:hypothetical protein